MVKQLQKFNNRQPQKPDPTPEELAALKKQEEANQVRQAELNKVKQAREMKLRLDEDLKKNRNQMMENVSSIIIKHILAAELYITSPTEGASLFNESNFKRQEWNI
jgi:type II secretory pathway component PulC